MVSSNHNNMRTTKSRRKQTNPLTQLRQILGSDARPLSVSKLGLLVDIPAASLRSVETGRRTFNPDLQRRMRRRGLEWLPETKRWVFAFNHQTPLSLPLLESFRGLSSAGTATFQQLDIEALKRRIAALMENVAPTSYRDLLLDLHDALENFLEAYKVEGAQEDFRETTLWYKPIENDAGGQRLIKGYNWQNPPDLIDEEKAGESSVSISQSAA
jgi:hypothetical protein